MGELKGVDNPIVLEERKMDLELRKKIVEKKMREEKKLGTQKQTRYDKVLKELQIWEEKWLQKQKLKKKPNMQEILQRKKELKSKLIDVQDEKDKFTMMTEERLSEIDDNINDLTQQLVEISATVIEAKNALGKYVCEYERLHLQSLAMERMQAAREREEAEKVELENKQNKLRMINQKFKYKNVEEDRKQRVNA